MHRLTIAILLMAAAAMPRMGTPISVRPDSAPQEAPSLAETQTVQPACCGSANHMARLLCLHRLVLSQFDESARAARLSEGPE